MTALQPPPGARLVALEWLATRLVMVALAVGFEWRAASGDLDYYYRNLTPVGGLDPARAMLEYPTPVLWLLQAPLLAGRTSGSYAVAFALGLLVVDAAFTAYLVARAERGPQVAGGWILLTFALGPLCYLRFDLVTSVLLGISLVEYRRRPGVAGVALALAVGIKLWPILALVAFLGIGRRRLLPLLTGFAATGALLVAGSLAYAGPARLVSPLGYQSDRGLNVDSVWATVPMVDRVANFDAYPVAVSRFAAFEIAGPGVAGWLATASVAAALGVATVVALGVRALRRSFGDPITVAGIAAFATAVLIVTNKTLSPQYLVWLAASVPIVATALPPHGGRRLLAAVAAAAALTHITYPLMAGMFTTGGPGIKLTLSTGTLALRNVLLVIGLAVCTRALWRWDGKGPSSPVTHA